MKTIGTTRKFTPQSGVSAVALRLLGRP